MGIPIGETRSGREVEVNLSAHDAAASLLAAHPEPDDLFDVYCLILFLKLKEKHGWLLSGLGAEGLFARLADDLNNLASINAAVDTARRIGLSASAFDDLEHGRSVALPDLRVRPWL